MFTNTLSKTMTGFSPLAGIKLAESCLLQEEAPEPLFVSVPLRGLS